MEWLIVLWQGRSNTWLIHTVQRPGYTHLQTLQLPHRLWQQVGKHRNAMCGAFSITWSKGRSAIITNILWELFHPALSRSSESLLVQFVCLFVCVWLLLFSGDFSVLDSLLLGSHLTLADTGIPSPEWTLSVRTWEVSKPWGFFQPAEQHWHWLSFPIQTSGQSGLNLHS